MKNSNRRFNRIATLLGVIAVFGVVGLSSPASAGNGAKVEGVQVPIDAAAGVYTMSGDLVGMWYTTSFELGVTTVSGVVTGSGTELFLGCFNANHNATCDSGEPTGTIDFSFRYSGRFDLVTGAIIHGRCQHPVTGGSGDFAAVSGQLTFHDDPSGCSFYKGQLDW